MKLSHFRLFCIVLVSETFLAPWVQAQIADPILIPSEGTSAQNVTVTVTEATPQTAIYYTLDGTVPTTSSATVATGNPLVVNLGTTLRVEAVQGIVPSDIVTATYSSNGFISSSDQHTLVLKNDGSVWGWGLNSSGELGQNNLSPTTLPTAVPLTGANPIVGVTSSTTTVENGLPTSWELQFFGETGLNPNLTVAGTALTILQAYQQGFTSFTSAALPPPIVVSEDYLNPQSVILTPASGETYFYTLDGSNPVTSSTRVAITSATSLDFTTTTTLQVVAVEAGYGVSSIASDTITVSPAEEYFDSLDRRPKYLLRPTP